LFVPQFVAEFHFHLPAIDIAGKVEQVDFQQGAGAADGGLVADIGHPGIMPTAEQQLHHINPGHRYHLALERHIGGGKADGPPQLVAMGHPAVQAEGAPQHLVGVIQPPRRQCLADQGAADPLAVHPPALGTDHLEIEGAPGPGKQFEIPAPVAAEAEIVAHHQKAHAEPVDQQAADEIVRRLGGEGGVEAHAQQAVDAEPRQLQVFLPQSGQPGRRLGPGKQLLGLGFEHHDAGRHPEPARLLGEAAQYRLVPQMHAIEVADGQHTAVMPWLDVVNAANKLHKPRCRPLQIGGL
jgi:hypothetical protein